MRSNFRFRSIPVLLLTFALGLAACDFNVDDVDLIVDIKDEPISLGDNAGRVAVAPNSTTASTSTISNSLGVDSVEDLEKIGLSPSSFTFAPSSGKTGGVQADGTLRIVLTFNGVPLPLVVTVTVDDDVVTEVQPRSITFAGTTIDETAILGVLNSLPENQRPNLKNWQTMSIDQVAAEINAGLAMAQVPFGIIVQTTGDLSGTLKLNQFTIDAKVVKETN